MKNCEIGQSTIKDIWRKDKCPICGGWDEFEGGCRRGQAAFSRTEGVSIILCFQKCQPGEMLTLWLLLPMACGAPDLADQAQKIFLHLKPPSKHVGHPLHDS